MSEDDAPGVYDLEKTEVQTFFDLARESKERSKEILEFYFDKKISLSDRGLSKICELYAISCRFENYLTKVFQMDLGTEKAVFRLTAKHAQSVIMLVFAVKELRIELPDINITLETH